LNDGFAEERPAVVRFTHYDAKSLHPLYRTFLDRAMMHLRRAVERGPLNLKFNDNLGQVLMNARRDDQGLTQLNKTVEMDRNFAGTYADLAALYRCQGNYDQWLDTLKKNATLNESQEDLALVNEVQPIYKQSGYKAAVSRIIEL
jgi:lipopolysaccharide biosynthesis regulator YciM